MGKVKSGCSKSSPSICPVSDKIGVIINIKLGHVSNGLKEKYYIIEFSSV